jgi:Fur family ferric uptake transcriptional regulator
MTARLCDVPAGETVRLADVETGGPASRRLAELGLTTGVEITVLQASRGPLLVAVRGARVAVGHDIAARLRVTSLSTGNPA